jgi:hypothetical protein
MVYVIDEKSIHKGIVDHHAKGGGHMIKFKGSKRTARYYRNELFCMIQAGGGSSPGVNLAQLL